MLYRLERALHYETLDNGLQLRLLSLPDSPVVSLVSRFEVGSRDESAQEHGYAHLFEHLLFKGSEAAPGDAYQQAIASYAGRFNATTGFDDTHYYLTLPSEALPLALFLEADRFRHPLLTVETVENQKGAVLEEMAMRIDNLPYVRLAMDALLPLLADTPYGHSVIGDEASISAATPARLTAFHQAHYRPERMQLTLVGDLLPQSRDWVMERFADWGDNATTQRDGAAVAGVSERARKPLSIARENWHAEVVDARGPWPVLLLGWHTVPPTHPDAAAVALLERHLLQSTASLLAQTRLDDPDQLWMMSLPLPMALHGMSAVALVPRARASLDSLAQAVAALIEAVATTPLSPARLARLQQQWLDEQLETVGDPQALALQLSSTLAIDEAKPLTGPWERIVAVTPADLQRVAQRYYLSAQLRLDLLPPWYLRWGKRVLEWLPQSWADRMEAWWL
ncbi:pitrilysin family protein [Ferrimonas gelatinilytica]|uniref:Pitrilysin family protein n=1 Tax=Ferrimonas gelatinilytica TaxID=1255257 RepID=A0ABP9SE34_9GAMM